MLKATDPIAQPVNLSQYSRFNTCDASPREEQMQWTRPRRCASWLVDTAVISAYLAQPRTNNYEAFQPTLKPISGAESWVVLGSPPGTGHEELMVEQGFGDMELVWSHTDNRSCPRSSQLRSIMNFGCAYHTYGVSH